MNAILPIITLLIGGAIGYWVALKLVAAKQGDSGLADTRAKMAALEQEIRDYTARVATLASEKAALGDKLADQQAYVSQAQEQFKLQFENLANKIFEEKNSQSKQNLNELLKPLKDDLSGFKKHITESFGNHAKEQFALKREIENIVKVSGDMKSQTENLTKALKGDVKVQGNWGEMIVERILEASGLRKGIHYVPQAAGMGLKHPESGTLQKPDFIVNLPEGKQAIIDSKVSLTHYERFCSEEDDAAKPIHLSQFLQSVRAHVKGLEERRYQDTEGLKTLEFVLMFIPIEGAYALAMQQDGDLHSHAWGRKIIIVCPNTLFAILKMMDSMWKLDDQNRNVTEIFRRGGLLYDKFAGFLDDMEAIGGALAKAQDAYAGAFNKLSKGTGNLLNQATDLVKLGAKAQKKLPKTFALEAQIDGVLEAPREDAA
jgi:DNA recombination protein RmuC